MKRKILMTSAFALSLWWAGALASEASPYAGQEAREIKALSASEITGLLSGKGMGYAKAAELNGYPGPAHVLDLAEELGISTEQRNATQAIFDQMETSAKERGADLVSAERALDEMFKSKAIDESSLSELVTKIGRFQSQLRAVHLKAHLEQRRLLNERQVTEYTMLRGYEHGKESQHHHRRE